MIDNGISEENKQKFKNTADSFKREIIFIPRPELESVLGLEVETGRWNISTFYRLFLCSILPQNVDRAIYLDCDTIIRHSLSELWNLELDGKIAAAADDCRSDRYKTELGLSAGCTYTNNGVMLVDLKSWRERKVERMFCNFIAEHNGNITYVDQGVLNGCLSKDGLVKVINTKFNAMTVFFDFNYKDLLRLRKPGKCLSEKEYDEATGDPYIVHFTSCFYSGTRPWNEHNDHPFLPEYTRYKLESEWRDTPYFEDDRKFVKKVMTKACHILPKSFMIAAISLIHSKIYPAFRALKSPKGGRS